MPNNETSYGRIQRRSYEGKSHRERVSDKDRADAYGANSDDEKSHRKNSGNRRSASIDGDKARVSDEKPRNEQDYGRRQRSDRGKSGRERHGYRGREKSMDEEGRDSKEEKKSRGCLQNSRDGKIDNSTCHRH